MTLLKIHIVVLGCDAQVFLEFTLVCYEMLMCCITSVYHRLPHFVIFETYEIKMGQKHIVIAQSHMQGGDTNYLNGQLLKTRDTIERLKARASKFVN